MIYLASPYSHPEAGIRIKRFKAVCKVAADMMRNGHSVFSPIAMSHPIAVYGGLPGVWEFWEALDEVFIEKCERFGVLTLEGWHNSRGVTTEINLAKALGRTIEIFSPGEHDVRID